MLAFFRSKIILLILATAFIVSCGSSKSNNSSEAAALDGAINEDTTLELNGDSDSRRAGALQTVYFDFDSSRLSSTTRALLEANALFLKENDGVDVQIEGHCDERGGIQYNLALGERRARAVKDYLVAAGVSDSRITIVSFGKERPLEFGHDESAWGKNRRANFVVTAK